MAVSTTRQAEPLGARLLRGAAGGLVSGAVSAAVAMWYADSTGGSAGVPLQMISTIIKGQRGGAARHRQRRRRAGHPHHSRAPQKLRVQPTTSMSAAAVPP
jgi:hypothetical protein